MVYDETGEIEVHLALKSFKPLNNLKQEVGMKKIFILFFFLTFFWLNWIFVAAHKLSLVVAGRGHFPGLVHQPCFLQTMDSRCLGSSSCGSWGLEH